MNEVERFDLLLLGFRNDLARERTLRLVRGQPAGASGPQPLERETPLPYRLYTGLSQDEGFRLLRPLRECGAHARLVAALVAERGGEAVDEPRAARQPSSPRRASGTVLLLAALVLGIATSLRLSANPLWRGALPPAGPALSPLGSPRAVESSRLNEQAISLNASGEYETAAARLRDAIDQEPGREVLHDNLRIVLRNWAVEELNRGRPEKALDIAEDALRDDADPWLLGVAGVAHARMGEWRRAREVLERAVAQGLAEPATYFALGTTYRQLGNLEGAVEMLQRAKEAGASGGDFEATLSKLERELDVEWNFLELASPHFEVGFEDGENQAAARLVLQALEDAYFFVGQKLGYYPPQRTQVVLYSGEEFHDVTQSPSWTGGIFDGRIKLPVRGLDRGSPLLERTLRHEFAHVLVTLLSRNRTPVWLSEGVALWAEEDEDGEREAWAHDTIAGQHLLPLGDLERPFLELPESRVPIAYAESYLAVRTILDHHGAGRLRALLRALGDGESLDSAFRSVLAAHLARFEADLVRDLTG
jgi:tetratricopeptide (TPR) repeat protein